MLGAALGLCLAGGPVLSGCEDARQAFGLERNVPDEFAVVSRAPLSMPPDFALRPPQPGAPRPQEPTTREQAQRVVLATAEPGDTVGGEADRGDVSRGEGVLLARAGTEDADPNIRRTVDEEAANLMRADESFVDRLMFWQESRPPGTVVDPQAEAQRLAGNAATGAPLNAGEVPTIERRERAPLEGVFDGLFDF
ncbi:MAG: DUF3035 domain-containing protein [Alphaproteobacteria bacterium]|jgi:hypothetical protein|nr:DUF3035 domain-containing protein [Alphaproteobacteria bacterium]